MLKALDISVSGMSALLTKHRSISENIASAEVIRDAQGNYKPYRAKEVHFAPGNPLTGSPFGVHVVSVQDNYTTPMDLREVKPGHEFYKHANEEGMLEYPNVNPVREQTDSMLTSNAFQANATAFEATKSMISTALRLLA